MTVTAAGSSRRAVDSLEQKTTIWGTWRKQSRSGCSDVSLMEDPGTRAENTLAWHGPHVKLACPRVGLCRKPEEEPPLGAKGEKGSPLPLPLPLFLLLFLGRGVEGAAGGAAGGAGACGGAATRAVSWSGCGTLRSASSRDSLEHASRNIGNGDIDLMMDAIGLYMLLRPRRKVSNRVLSDTD